MVVNDGITVPSNEFNSEFECGLCLEPGCVYCGDLQDCGHCGSCEGCYSQYRSNLTVRKIQSKVGKAFIKEHHYSHGCHNGPVCYGMFDFADTLVGVLAIATPCSENVRRSIFGNDHVDHVTELHRLVLYDHVPKNSESMFISRALKLLKQEKPRIWAVIAFSDTTEDHIGTIYQACNFIYYGRSGKARFYVDGDDRLRHPRQCGINITVKQAKEKGWKPVMRQAKHRYVILLPDNKGHRRRLLSMMKVESEEYPKAGKS